MLSSKNSRASNSAPQKSRQRPGDPANSGLCRHPSSNVPHPRSAPSSFAVGPARPQPRRGQANFSRSGARRWIGQRLKQNQLSHDDLFEKKLWIQPALWATHLGFLGVQAADDLVIGDFRGSSYDAWKATGTAFQKGPAAGDLLTRLEIENAASAGVASSEIEGDAPMGTLTSPEFRLSKKYVSFRIGGGNYEQHTWLNLLLRGQVVRSATGYHLSGVDSLAPAHSALTGLRRCRIPFTASQAIQVSPALATGMAANKKPPRFPGAAE